MTRLILLLVAFMAAAESASAQVPSTASPLAPPFLAECGAHENLKLLTQLFNKGDWPDFQTNARVLLDALRHGVKEKKDRQGTGFAICTPRTTVLPDAESALDYTSRHVALVWIGSDALGKTQLMRAVVHWPEPEAYSADLPGIGGGNGGLTEVVLAASLDARAVSLYTSTPEKDPFVEQLDEFIQAIFAPLSSTVAGLLGKVRGPKRPESEVPMLAVTVKAVLLPLRRASIRLQTKARDLIHIDDFTNAVVDLATTLKFDGAGRSDRAREQMESLLKTLPAAAEASCKAAVGTASAAATAGDELRAEAARSEAASRLAACREALDKALKSAFETAMEGSPSEGDAKVIANVDSQFRALAVRALSSNAELEMTFKNRPPTHFAFGAGTAVVAKGRLNRVRTKIDDDSGFLVSDPLPRVMTMAFVNWSPGGYDETSARLSGRQRVRPFFGAALTPDFGAVGGVNVLLTRGVGVIAGAGLLFGKGAEADEIGKAPASKEDPFKLALARTLFVGISYSYK